FGTQLNLPVSATDADPETLTIQVSNLPAFGTFQSTGNGIGTLSFNPALSDAGTYNDITVTVTDEHGGSASTVFHLVVDANYQPVVAAVNNVTLNEKATAQLNLSATDENENDALSWSFTGLPSFVTVTTNGGTAQLDLAPGYADNGTYQVTARVEDGNNGFDTTSFTITVNDVDPVKVIYMNFGDATYTAGAPWNNTAKAPALNDNFANLKDATGATTSVGIQLLTAWGGVNNLGMNTGSNSGVYPDAVLRSSYFTTTIARSVRVYGLDANTQYNFRFLGSRANPNAGIGVTTTYTIGATTVSLDTKDNAQNTAQISSVQPAADGSVTFVVNAAAGSSFGYLNSLVIESIFDDQTAPAKARNLSAQNVDGKVRLNWTDAAYNETSYEVFRATNIAGPFSLIHTGAANLVQHEDAAVAGNTTYYYTVRAANSYGNAPYSDTVSVTTPNVAPVLNPIANVTLNTQQSTTVAVSATDPGDVITLSASNLPSFATFTDNGNGTGSIQINAGNTPGVYSGITITASDNFGGSSSRTFNITVNVANLTKVFVNFNQTFPVGSPWNSTNAAPNAGLTLADLKDQTNNSTGITLTVLDAWTAQNTLGVVTGNNSGIYPDDVMRTFYYYSGTAERRIRLSGLSADKKYDLSFFASRANFSAPLTTRYTVNGNSVEVDATNNSSNVGKLDGISPDSNGEILITVLKSGSSANAYLGALVIDAYPLGSTTPVAPTNLTATGISKTQIRLNWGATVGATGYEVFRSTSEAGSYSKIGDVPTGTLTYTDASLSAG
ncbi:Ig-like domain-containing protein, partial [Parasegetibacter sp. NRK P23]|uniref:beta strand repeat-containing protein n=1 Tax=Parasegetibacter sp. NRK P23 TaxID=2942999 RepID=UPI002044A405